MSLKMCYQSLVHNTMAWIFWCVLYNVQRSLAHTLQSAKILVHGLNSIQSYIILFRVCNQNNLIKVFPAFADGHGLHRVNVKDDYNTLLHVYTFPCWTHQSGPCPPHPRAWSDSGVLPRNSFRYHTFFVFNTSEVSCLSWLVCSWY